MFSSAYAKAGIHDADLSAAYRVCRRIVRQTGSTDYAITQLIAPALRPAAWALYAAGRTVDDLTDTATGPRDDRAARLDAWTTAFETELQRGTSGDPVRRALIHAVQAWHLEPGDLRVAFLALRSEARGGLPTDWQRWSAHAGRLFTSSFALQGLLALGSAGLQVPLRVRHHQAVRQWVDAVFLIDALEDLSADAARGQVGFPTEELRRHGVTVTDLAEARWTPAVAALLGHLGELARRWLDQPELALGLPPALVVIVDAVTDLHRLRLRVALGSGPRLLRRKPRLRRHSRWRVLLPARAKSALAWRLSPLSVPQPVPRQEARTVQVIPPGPYRPPPHPSGVRPPALPPGRLPRHVAVIMDGNGRWATERGLPRQEGHRAGAAALRDVIHGAVEIGLPHLTVYAFSTENWRRPVEELIALHEVLGELMDEADIVSLGIRVRWAGEPAGLPLELFDALQRQEIATAHHTGLTLTVCANYGGRSELARAAGALARAAVAGHLNPARVSERLLSRYLLHPDLPDVDLLWRTGGERRISNFLLWQIAYAELHFTDAHWPEADRRDLWQAVAVYAHRERRYGAAPGHPGT